MASRRTPALRVFLLPLLTWAVLSRCADNPTDLDLELGRQLALMTIDCVGDTKARMVSCSSPTETSGGVDPEIIGGQNTYLKLTSSNVSYNSGTEIFQFDVTVQNLMNEAIGTPDGTVSDPEGIQVFFYHEPKTTGGTGTVTVANEDGTGTFLYANEPFFAYNQILAQNAVSSARTWQLNVPTTVTSFSFKLAVNTDVQKLLVINEVMVNPANYNANPDATGEWFELYNAGTLAVELQNLVIADSAASGRRPYHTIASSVVIPSGGYAVLGISSNTTTNGGVPVDYAYGSALSPLANSLDAVKIAIVYGTDTLTLDRTQYAQASVSAQDGVSRELKNPSLDNSNMDGSNWAGALATAVYGPGGRGTPKAQNSTFTPNTVAGPVYSGTAQHSAFARQPRR